jgi:kynureninase
VNTAEFRSDQHFAAEMEASDPLAEFRGRFRIPKAPAGEQCIYFCGHSLGLQPKSASSYIEQELKDWAELGVDGHFHGRHPWMPYHRDISHQVADLVGAQANEVVVMNSLTVNLHLLMASFYRPTRARHKILIEGGAFPSDQYAVQSQLRFHGFDSVASLIELKPRRGESYLRDEDIDDSIERDGETIALILLGGVNYATGQAFDMRRITEAGHSKGCVVAFDLAHAVGNIPLRLHQWGPDFAVWCSYKYLNGGPGCVGGCFVHERHAQAWELPRFAGWWGHDEKTRFQMGPEFHPMPGAEGWQVSNPPILALAPLRASMEIFAEAGMDRLREKSVSLTAYLEFLLREKESNKFSIVTPPDPQRRGAQLSIRLAQHGHELCQRLTAGGVIGDWREPDIFRVAPVPLYNSYKDVYGFAQRFLGALT